MTGVEINSQLDALVWQCVDDAFTTGDVRAAVAALQQNLERRRHAATRASVNYYLGVDWLVDLLRRTDPLRSGCIAVEALEERHAA